MTTITTIIGSASQPDLAEAIHKLDHRGGVEFLSIDRNDTLRRRLRGVTDKGTEVVVALDRSEQLSNGAVLTLDENRAIVVRLSEERWLRLVPRDSDAALEAGYFVGNLHWRVRFEPGAIAIALEGPVETYMARLAPLTAQRKIRVGDGG